MAFAIEYSPSFKRALKKLPKNIQTILFEKFDLFQVDMFDHHLDTHKLHGNMKDLWSFSINYKYRIIFTIIGKTIKLLDVGDHGIYTKFR